MASRGEEIELLKHVNPVKPREDLCTMPVLIERKKQPQSQCNLKNNKSSEVNINVHTPQNLTENSDSNSGLKTADK